MITLTIYHTVGNTAYTIMEKKFEDIEDAVFFGKEFSTEDSDLIFDTWNEETCEQININYDVEALRTEVKRLMERR